MGLYKTVNWFELFEKHFSVEQEKSVNNNITNSCLSFILLIEICTLTSILFKMTTLASVKSLLSFLGMVSVTDEAILFQLHQFIPIINFVYPLCWFLALLRVGFDDIYRIVCSTVQCSVGNGCGNVVCTCKIENMFSFSLIPFFYRRQFTVE